jgi:hypothetical protein
MTDGNCNAPINVTLPINVQSGHVIAATATDPSNNTSEFSACVVVNPHAVRARPTPRPPIPAARPTPPPHITPVPPPPSPQPTPVPRPTPPPHLTPVPPPPSPRPTPHPRP